MAAPSRGSPSRRGEAAPALIRRARDDRAAFGEVYDLYFRRVYVFCASRGTSREEAEDLTAQTFERALTAIGQYQERGRPFSAWLLRIAAHLAADRARQAQPLTVPPDAVDVEGIAPAQARGEDWATRWEQASWLRGHLAALPAEQRQAAQLRYYEEYSFGEIGRRLGRSEGAAKQLLRRALTTLRTRIHEEGRSDG